MKVIERTECRFVWKDLANLTYHPEPKRKRSSGVHVSQVIKHIAIKLGKLTEHDKDDEMPLIVLLGMAWEHYAARLYKDIVWQPGELKFQSIVGSPDGYSADKDERPLIEEFKYTTKSMRHRHDNFIEEWMWMSQGMAYLKQRRSKETRPALGSLVRYHVCWGMADYVKPIKPCYMRYVVQFSDQEIDTNWGLIQRYRDQVVAEHHA